MVIIGRIFKTGAWWAAEADAIGVYTQGKTRAEAEEMLIDAVQEVVHLPGFTVKVSRMDGDDVLVEPSDGAALAAYMLRYQRETSGLSLADVAQKLGAASRNAYAAYEQGKSSPSVDKLRELAAVVAPGYALAFVPRRKVAR
jgi:DNA-binding XRE family transcriptional regulator